MWMAQSPKRRRLADAYTFPGFRPLERVQGLFGDPRARLITLARRGKKQSAAGAVRRTAPGTTADGAGCGICPVPINAFTSIWRFGVCTAGGAAR